MNDAPVMRLGPLLSCLAVALALSGCVSRDISDLESYVEEVLARKGGQIDPLPPIKPYERFVFVPAGRRDPFESFLSREVQEPAAAQIADADQQKYTDEIVTHNLEELENFELDSLRMVGILQDTEELWGIIADSGGTVHRVKVGNYVGRNFGKITNIEEDAIQLREITRDSEGRWEEREASLALSEE